MNLFRLNNHHFVNFFILILVSAQKNLIFFEGLGDPIWFRWLWPKKNGCLIESSRRASIGTDCRKRHIIHFCKKSFYKIDFCFLTIYLFFLPFFALKCLQAISLSRLGTVIKCLWKFFLSCRALVISISPRSLQKKIPTIKSSL